MGGRICFVSMFIVAKIIKLQPHVKDFFNFSGAALNQHSGGGNKDLKRFNIADARLSKKVKHNE